jgi:hypothetical protein
MRGAHLIPRGEEGQVILAAGIIPQAYAVGFLVWMLIVKLATGELSRRSVLADVIVGAGLGFSYYLLGAGIKWVVPWMILIFRR